MFCETQRQNGEFRLQQNIPSGQSWEVWQRVVSLALQAPDAEHAAFTVPLLALAQQELPALQSSGPSQAYESRPVAQGISQVAVFNGPKQHALPELQTLLGPQGTPTTGAPPSLPPPVPPVAPAPAAPVVPEPPPVPPPAEPPALEPAAPSPGETQTCDRQMSPLLQEPLP
jgi:hypothetical protein